MSGSLSPHLLWYWLSSLEVQSSHHLLQFACVFQLSLPLMVSSPCFWLACDAQRPFVLETQPSVSCPPKKREYIGPAILRLSSASNSSAKMQREKSEGESTREDLCASRFVHKLSITTDLLLWIPVQIARPSISLLLPAQLIHKRLQNILAIPSLFRFLREGLCCVCVSWGVCVTEGEDGSDELLPAQ